MITGLPECMQEMSRLQTGDGTEIAVRRCIPLLGPEMKLCRQGKAEQVRRKLEAFAPGLDPGREPVTVEPAIRGIRKKPAKKRRKK